jgi:diguanylate cyclase (GGDEF)-like protein
MACPAVVLDARAARPHPARQASASSTRLEPSIHAAIPMPHAQPEVSASEGLTRISEQRFRGVLLRGAVVAAAAHLLFIAFFASLGIYGLALFNVGSVALYAVCLWLIRRARYGTALGGAIAEVIAHGALAIVTIGWASGFQYYLLVLVPLVFFHPQWSLARKLGVVALLVACFLAFNFALAVIPPLHPVPTEMLGLIRVANIAAAFGLLAYFSHHYATAAHRAESQLERLAGTDPLTGLHNRRRLIETAALEQARHRRSGHPLSLVLCDIDNFKQVNDRHGHDCGDLVLTTVAARVRDSVRGPDSVARWGGEELLLLLPETGLADAQAVAEKLRRTIEVLRVSCGGRELGVTITIGVAELASVEELDSGVARADRAMLEGKRAGKNRVVLAAPPA